MELNFSKKERPVERPNEEHCCVMLVIDVSSSMKKFVPSGITCIEEVNNGINRMIRELVADARLGDIVDLSIITFADEGNHQVYLPFGPIKDIKDKKIKLVAGGETYAVEALNMALENIRKRGLKYNSGCYKPWLVFLTDGELFDDVSEIGQIIKQCEFEGELRTWCFGVTEYKKEQLQKISNKVFEIVDYNFSEFFSWIGKSQATISQVKSESIGNENLLESKNTFKQIED